MITDQIDAAYRESYLLLFNANAPAWSVMTWAGVRAAHEASWHHPGSPWTEKSVGFALASLESCREGRDEAAEDFAKRAALSAWAAQFRPDDFFLHYSAWLDIVQRSRSHVSKLLGLMEETVESRERSRKVHALVGKESGGGLPRGDGEWTDEQVKATRDILAQRLESLKACEHEGERLPENMKSFDDILHRVAEIAEQAMQLEREAGEKGYMQPVVSRIRWGQLIGPAARWLIGNGESKARPPINPVQAFGLARLTAIGSAKASQYRRQVQHYSQYFASTVLSGEDQLVYYDTDGEIENGRSGRQVYLDQLVGELRQWILTCWVVGAASEAAQQPELVEIERVEADLTGQIADMNNRRLLEENVIQLRRFIAGVKEA
jgi:hypothetical protein